MSKRRRSSRKRNRNSKRETSVDPPRKKQKVTTNTKSKTNAPNKKETTYISEIQSTYIVIHTTVNHRKTKTQENIRLKFQRIQIDENGQAVLQIQEPNKSMKAATAGILNKYKKRVIELLLHHYFKYDIPKNSKFSKGKLLCILCGCCGIPVDNVEEIIADFMTATVFTEIIEHLDKQSESIVVDTCDFAKDNAILNMDNHFIEDYNTLFDRATDINKNTNALHKALSVFWKQLVENFRKNAQEIAMLKAFINSYDWLQKQNIFKELQSKYDANSFHKWARFSYGLFETCYGHFKCTLKQKLVSIALEQAQNKPKRVQKDSNNKLYLVYGMMNATANSMLRKGHGLNYKRTNKVYLVSIINQMLWKYENLKEFIENKDIPKELHIQNRGGLRIVKQQFVPIGETVINQVTPHLNNMFWRTKGNIKSTMDGILKATDDLSGFKNKFDWNILQNTIEQYLNTNNEKERIKVDEKLLNKMMEKAFLDFRRGIITRSFWSYVKKKRNLSTTITLRSKLQIYHLSADRKLSSLQTS
eukprot:138141_1